MKTDRSHLDKLRTYLDPIAKRFEQPDFIQDDPISIPHGFEKRQDREIIGLFAALLAWGRRDIMLAKLVDLCERMEFTPHEFILTYSPSRQNRVTGFVHRTFNATDLEGLIFSLQSLLSDYTSIEAAFLSGMTSGLEVESGIQTLSDELFNRVPGQPSRIRKHLARPSTGSACKRWNMYLRWMVRPGPVDLGLWTCLKPGMLMLPLDVHSGNQARAAGLLSRRSNDWKAALELTENCRMLDPDDPVKYDFALFGTGSAGKTLTDISSI